MMIVFFYGRIERIFSFIIGNTAPLGVLALKFPPTINECPRVVKNEQKLHDGWCNVKNSEQTISIDLITEIFLFI